MKHWEGVRRMERSRGGPRGEQRMREKQVTRIGSAEEEGIWDKRGAQGEEKGGKTRHKHRARGKQTSQLESHE
jgi:hypothetical protein